MSFSEIGVALGITEVQAKQIFETAIRKLKQPLINRGLWEYMNIGDDITGNSDMQGDTL